MKKELKIIVYDIETSPLLAWVFSLGKQRISHTQLQVPYNIPRIICLYYRLVILDVNTGKFKLRDTKSLVFNIKTLDDSKIIKEFDKVIESADYLIGKNSDRFDLKIINTVRWLHKIPAIPDWSKFSGDLEKQIKKFFRFPSNRLDYLAKIRLGSGKVKMELDDWIQIVYNKNKTALKKMVRYNKKDTEDTVKLLIDSFDYVNYTNFNAGSMSEDYSNLRCSKCGTAKISKNGTRRVGLTTHYRFYCSNGHCAGRATKRKDGSYTQLV